MSNEGLLFHPIHPNVAGAFGARLSLHNAAKRGPVFWSAPGAHGRRLGAFCTVANNKKGVYLQMNKNGFEERYTSPHRLPSPTLTKVTIKRVTTTAERINLTLEILVEFEAYSKGQFERYADAFLKRPEVATPLTVHFGHIDKYGGRSGGTHTIRGVWVIGGGYTQEGAVWKCKFKAIAPANAILQIDMSNVDLGFLKGKHFLAKVGSGSQKYGVSSFHEYLLHCLQINGSKLTEDMQDGEEVMGTTGVIGKVYKPFNGSPIVDGGSTGGANTSPALSNAVIGVDTGAVEYITLGFIVEAVNRVILETINKREPGLELSLKIILDPKDWSYVPGTLFKSGCPTEVLFLDGSKTGKYEDRATPGTGKDFEINVSNTKSVSGYEANHSKLLLSRRAVIQPLVDALTEIRRTKEAQIKAKGKGTSLDTIDTRIMAVGDFFEHLFNLIKNATGGYVNLCFTHPFAEHINGGEMQELKIINASMIFRRPDSYLELKPLNGDGSTLSSTFDGKLPDSMVALAIITGTGTGSHTSGRAATDKPRLTDKGQLELARARLANTTSNSTPPGVYAKIAASNFSPSDMASACSALLDYRDLSLPSAWENGAGWTEYFDTELSAEMEGLYPFVVGNRITSESLPKFLSLRNKMSFVVLDVDDNIEAPGVWTTSVRARLCHHGISASE